VGFVIGETIFGAHRHNCAPWLMGTPFRITKCQALISVCRSLYDRVFSRIATSMAALSQTNAMAGQAIKHTRSGYAIALTAITVVLLVFLFSVAVVATVRPVLFAKEEGSSPGWLVIQGASTTSWNVGVVILGTAVGIITSIAFTAQDAFLTRAELVSPNGVSAMFLRPLSAKRGLDQVLKRRFTIRRTALVFSFLATTLTSAATVALLSAQTVSESVTNHTPSFPLDGLNASLSQVDKSGGVLALPSALHDGSAERILSAALTPFMYRSAYVNGQLALPDDKKPATSSLGFVVSEPADLNLGIIHNVAYDGLWTSGVGINTRSYQTWNGHVEHFNTPREFTLNSLQGEVFGTTIAVECLNKTSEYERQEIIADLGPFLTIIGKAGGDPNTNITLASFPHSSDYSYSRLGTLVIGSNLTTVNNEPVHVLAVAGMFDTKGTVFECTYSGREIVARVSMSGPDEPLVIGPVTSQGSPIGPAVKRLVAYHLHRQIAPNGGVLAKGLMDALYMREGESNNRTAEVLGTILSQSAQAAISALRQRVEITNLYNPPAVKGVHVEVNILVVKIGGGGAGWFALYGLLLLGALTGLGRVCTGAVAVPFEAQDTAILLARALGDQSLTETTQVKFVQGTGLVWDNGPGRVLDGDGDGAVSEDGGKGVTP